MSTRRDFLKLATATAAGATVTGAAQAETPASNSIVAPATTGAADRAYWCDVARRLADPLLAALSRRKLREEMPVESHVSAKDRANYTYLEGFGRLLCGLSPWLELGGDTSAEGRLRQRYAELARAGMDAATDPASPDFMNFRRGGQPLVDAAFLAQAILRSPTELWDKLDARVKANVVAAMKSTRPIQAYESNWKLFATTVEVFLHYAGEKRDDARLFEGLTKHRNWYVGDGVYGDGPEFHWDYYNSFVIQPMLIEALDRVGNEASEWTTLRDKARARLTRWAAIQERLIAPDGSYPIIGRSIAYRCGAFQGLALAALRHMLPAEVAPAQARRALTATVRRTMKAPGVWDAKGWLQIGVAGHQPGLGEGYISTGSLYLCSVALLPLGLPETDPFWSAPSEPTTWEKVWSGRDLPADHARYSSK